MAASISNGLQLPSTPLQPPQEIVSGLKDALSAAAKNAEEFRATHPVSERWMIQPFALSRMGWPPSGDAQKAELELLHRVAATRTPDQTTTAQWYAEHGMNEAWDIYLAEYQKTVGPRQAAAAAKLLHDTLFLVNEITQTGKAAAGRTRPYNVDPTLQVAVTKPGGSPSYPSGHTSAAFAAAIVLGYLMPQRADEFLGIASQAAYARVYGGVHFPSDVFAGAKLAATVALYMCSISGLSGATEQAAMAPASRKRPRRRRAA